MSQMTFSDYEYSLRKRKTKREEFLDIMNEIIPWEEWVEFVRPYYPNGKRGRPTKGIEKMLRMYLLQIWFNLSDEGVEDAIYDSYAFRKFMNIDFMEEQVPDATTLLKFRHLLEENHLGEVFFKAINRVMEATGHIMHGGTIVDAIIISAPSSTKNAKKTGSGNASDQKGKCMEIRDEMPHWCGFRKWFGAYNHSHSSQCTRYNRSTQITAGGRSCCIWGQRIYWN